MVFLVFGKKSNGLADGVAYDSKEAVLLSMKRQGQSETDYKIVSMHLATLDMVKRWTESN
jgi:hypothetical protein